MCSTDGLREFVIERLTAAAEDIFVVFKNTIVQYEAEIDRQRRQLDMVWKPHIYLERIDAHQYHGCKEEGSEDDQQVCNQERSFSLDQERSFSPDQGEPEPPQIKEEQEEACSSVEAEQLVLKQETDTFMWTITHDESDHDEPEPQQLFSHYPHVPENPPGSEHEDSEPALKSRVMERNVLQTNPREIACSPNQSQSSLKCDTCGEEVKNKTELHMHQRAHTGKKMLSCYICGKMCSYKSQLIYHIRSHTGERPYSCSTCGKGFLRMTHLNTHMKIHSGEKPYACATCGTTFTQKHSLDNHKRIHTGERPYSCATCGTTFTHRRSLDKHQRIHTGEKPYSCDICERTFTYRCDLTVHIRRAHTGERPYLCVTCGKRFYDSSSLSQHMKIHANK
ncbi:zinc finger protein OZF-like [Cheilinus undulatus]|uniref:zinc finger protein OZF-like n=1 Tax=Cheilinus undulatus TaxID=241271 RepID=UPI001BD56E38|nr:zinc finger protein OZF-like [Cheilinus undulatus]